MNKKEFQEMHTILRKQKEEVGSSREAAAKLLSDLGILHLLVPKGTSEASRRTK